MAMPARPSAATAEPALKPNQPTHSSEAPITAKREVVRRHVVGAVAEALAEHQGADQARDAGVDVHHGAAGEVERARACSASRGAHTQWAIGA